MIFYVGEIAVKFHLEPLYESETLSVTPVFYNGSSKQLVNELRNHVEIDVGCAIAGCFAVETLVVLFVIATHQNYIYYESKSRNQDEQFQIVIFGIEYKLPRKPFW